MDVTLVNITSFGRSCLIIVSNFVKQTSSSKELKLNCDVALSNTQMPKLLFFLESRPSRMEMQ